MKPFNRHLWPDTWLFDDNTGEPPEVQMLDMVRDIRRAVTLILIVLVWIAI